MARTRKALIATIKTKYATLTPAKKRALGAIFTILASGILAAVALPHLPVLTLPEFLEKVDPATVDAQKEGVRIVLTSSSLWFVGFGALLGLISFFTAAITQGAEGRRNFVFNNLFAVSSATFVLVGGVFLVMKP